MKANTTKELSSEATIICPLYFLFIIVLIASWSGVACTENVKLPPLHMAAQTGILVEVKQLIIGGYDVNQRDGKYGSTPLHQAVLFGHENIVEFLIAEGSDVNAQNSAGFSPLYLAQEKGYGSIVTLLAKHGATKQ